MKKLASWMPRPERGEVFEIGPIKAVGKTKTAARDLAIEVAGRTLALDYHPVVVEYRRSVGIAFNTPLGPLYHIVAEEWDGRLDPCTSYREGTTLDEVVRKMRLDLADRGWRRGETTSAVLLDPGDIGQFKEWAEWQERYYSQYDELVGRGWAYGAADIAAHQYAGGFV